MTSSADLLDPAERPDGGRPPILRIPPFPGSKVHEFERRPATRKKPSQVSLPKCIARMRDLRVGGTFWAAQPALPPSYLLVRSPTALSFWDSLEGGGDDVLLWDPAAGPSATDSSNITGECDPWHMLSRARGLLCDESDEVRLIAAVLGVPTYLAEQPDGPLQLSTETEEALLAYVLPVDAVFTNPFNGGPMDLTELIELCGFWRSLIDSNRSISSGIGFAFWKQDSVATLLWGGRKGSAFFRSSVVRDQAGSVAIWRSKTPPDFVNLLERQGTPLVEVEDGFLRSNGLGADCVPPLSITVDRLGAYFDPGQPSELEQLLEQGRFDQPMIERARQLRKTVVAAGLGKYEQGAAVLDRLDKAKRYILVPGQVEDDRSVLTGGSGLASNLELLQRVRSREPDSFILYKPHPDVVAGHRKGDVPEHICLQFADRIVPDDAISSLISMVDEVHVNTSLAGFEALMRHKKVTTYGVPFYAGWGLTCDLGPVPERRSRRRSLDELVAAALLIYPRYLDPVTGLPCPAEVVVDRLCAGATPDTGPLVAARRLQGRLKRQLQRLSRS